LYIWLFSDDNNICLRSVPGIQKIAKKLGIDGAPAVVGFDFHCGFCHPMYASNICYSKGWFIITQGGGDWRRGFGILFMKLINVIELLLTSGCEEGL